MANKGILLVVSGPSGAGKGTVMQSFLPANPDVFFSVSATTRAIRPGEKDGVNYYYLSKEEFLRRKSENGFLENACFCGNYYGTPKKEVLEKLENGTDVVLEIEVQGAMQVQKNYPDGVFVFIVPPSMEELRNRLTGRNTESAEVIEKRLSEASRELTLAEKYDYIIINDEAEAAADRLAKILAAEKLRTKQNIDFVKENLL